jgi:hypothetical protein
MRRLLRAFALLRAGEPFARAVAADEIVFGFLIHRGFSLRAGKGVETKGGTPGDKPDKRIRSFE